MYVDLSWSKEQLTKLLDARISKLVRQRYTNAPVGHADILPNVVNKTPAIDYLLARTLLRPRDIILFFNACIRRAEGNPQITPQMIKEAEGEYSRQRIRSLADEWSADYPYLLSILEILKGRPSQFPLTCITDDDCLELAIRLMGRPIEDEDMARAIGEIEKDPGNADGFRRVLASILYRVGVVGVKLERFEGVVWSTSGRRAISTSEFGANVRLSIHPCFWRGLGINPENSQNECENTEHARTRQETRIRPSA